MNSLELRTILENIQAPEVLETHPWVDSHVVQAVDRVTNLSGEKLVQAVSNLFHEMMPGVSPKRGVRLDTRWAEFGLLAAMYFAPLDFGTPAPGSLRNAWAQIDRAILLYVYGRTDDLSDEQVSAYTLIGNEVEIAPDSTLSDWHRKGIDRLAKLIQSREQYLSRQTGLAQSELVEKPELPAKRNGKKQRVIFILLTLFLALLVWGGIKAYRVYNQINILAQDVRALRVLANGPRMDALKGAGSLISRTHQDFSTLRAEIQPFLRVAPLFGWVPTYGGDIASAPALIEIADSMLSSADTAYQAGAPILDVIIGDSGNIAFDPPELIRLLKQAQPALVGSADQLNPALVARDGLNVNALSPRVHALVVDIVDPILGLMHDGLTLAVELPRLAGGSDEGPKTYLLLAQNEDELRPTGGFITGAGTLTIYNGSFNGVHFESSESQDDWKNPYPSAPWQLSTYMGNLVMVFRDTNWFTDFPRAALYADYFYSYAKEHSVDGVIAFDQHVLVEILRVIGPIRLDGIDYQIDSSNVITYMRDSKNWADVAHTIPAWQSKTFMDVLASHVMSKIFSGDGLPELVELMVRMLNEKHLLIQIDNPELTKILVRHGWDGAVRRGEGDFLMVVDTNIGYNKTNVMVEPAIVYAVDMENLAYPVANLSVEHKNHSSSLVPCSLRNRITIKNQGQYPIDRCYWDYLRVYTVDGTRLLQANPQSFPAEWMMNGLELSAQVDTLDEELAGIGTYGLLKVVPGQRTITTKLRYVLPVEVLSIIPGTRQVSYHLKVQKQPGTVDVPITIQLTLPADVKLISAPNAATVAKNLITYQSDLRMDLELDIIFEIP